MNCILKEGFEELKVENLVSCLCVVVDEAVGVLISAEESVSQRRSSVFYIFEVNTLPGFNQRYKMQYLTYLFLVKDA